MIETTTTPVNQVAVVGSIKLELSKKLGHQYEVILQAAESIKFSKETLDQDFAPLAKLRAMAKELGEMDNPHKKAWQDWNDARKSQLDPLKKCIEKKTAEYTKLAQEIKAELAKQAAEAARIKTIKDAIDSFTIEMSGKIAAANDLDTLTALQKRIGSEKSRSTFYLEFLPEFKEACIGLENALKAQKEQVSKLLELGKKEALATDDADLIEIQGQRELITAQIEENKETVQETAINAATRPQSIPETVVGVSTFVAPKPRRTALDWEILDMPLLQKKSPELVIVSGNIFEIDKKAKEFRTNGLFPKGGEYVWNGIRFCEKITY